MASESGCPIEFHRIDVDKCDPVFDKDCQGDKYIPFLRADYDRQTGRSPNSPREQVRRCLDYMCECYSRCVFFFFFNLNV